MNLFRDLFHSLFFGTQKADGVWLNLTKYE